MRAAPVSASSPDTATTSGGLVDFLGRVYGTAADAGFMQLAAAIAFHVLLAIGPLVVVILAAAGFFFGDEAVQGRLFGELAGLTGSGGASFIQDVVARSAGEGQGIAAAIGSFMFLWTASGIFAQVSQALNNINRVANGQRPVVVAPKEASWRQKLADTGWSFLQGRFAAVLMIVVIVALLVTSLIASSVISVMTSMFDRWLDTRWLVMLANLGVSFFMFTALSAALFRLLSQPRVCRQSALIGGLGAAVMFLIGRSVIGLVVPLAASASAFGPAASVVTVLYWAWFSAATLLLGFALAVTDAHDRASKRNPLWGLSPRRVS
jgi:membrane protein